MQRILSALLVAATAILFAGCSKDAAPQGTTPTAAARPAKLVITAIPDDSDEGRMRENFGYIAKLFQDATGIPCEYMHVQDYAASVTALATGQAHVAWFGAVTTAQAYQKMKDGLTVIGCRDIDKTFVSYYIGNAAAGVPKVADLAELAKLAKERNWNLTFGSKNSTSSHMMPRSFFVEQAKQKPEEAFKNVAYSGKHEIVLAKVANGEFEVGALGQPPYDRASAEDRAKAPIIYTTPTFTNYCFAGRSDLGPELIGKLKAALFKAHETEEGKKNLSYLKAAKYIPAEMSEWMGYVKLLESGIDIGS
jgi:phosphonate transport system substrate-binding protein